ncbi:cytochrome c family protein [Thalassococcus profundi]|jgi:cytochrome c|uniref:Cytochrome c family protein n=1 Tax=Thalassococcus profundi TaxID=2282382 RepID=A0A369THH8_9RHOB|nr:cytochrome c family protein [Thalassococcus profundi]RDD64084.1 cytochrome c family protein [Thalassococcus profundi]
MFNKMLGTAALMVLTAGVASAQEGDAEAGEKVFRKCMACHAVGEGAENKVGPQLNNLIGRTAGSLEDFNYSDAMVAKGEEGLVWDAETIAAFMEKPRDYVEGTKMSFAGLRKEEERTNVVAYLATFSEGM